MYSSQQEVDLGGPADADKSKDLKSLAPITHTLKSQPVGEDALVPAFQIDPFKDANVILPEMKQNLAIFINRSSHVDAQ